MLYRIDALFHRQEGPMIGPSFPPEVTGAAAFVEVRSARYSILSKILQRERFPYFHGLFCMEILA